MGGGDTLFASVRIRNSASNDKYLFAHAVSRSYNFLVRHGEQNIAHPDTVCNKKSFIIHPVQPPCNKQTTFKTNINSIIQLDVRCVKNIQIERHVFQIERHFMSVNPQCHFTTRRRVVEKFGTRNVENVELSTSSSLPKGGHPAT